VLSQADAAGALLGYREYQGYTPADPGQTIGRVVKTTGDTDFLEQTAPTPGADNVGVGVGPVVINEVMYGPVAAFGGTLFPNVNMEYVELRNVTNQPVSLFDPANPTNTWKVSGGINFTFPTNVTIPAYGYVILSNLLAADFKRLYPNVPTTAQIFGPVDGFLNNSGEKIELKRPGVPETVTVGTTTTTVVPYVVVDKLDYKNKGAWPTAPNETGPSLIRKSPLTFGDDPTNWQASPAAGGSPGRSNLNFGSPVPLTAQNNTTVAEGALWSTTFTFTDSPNDLGQTYTAVVTWGDGQTTTYNNVTSGATISHAFGDNGAYNVTVTVNDDAGGTGTAASVPATITNSPPVLTTIPDQTFQNPSTLAYRGTFTDGGVADNWLVTVDYDYHPGDTDAVAVPVASDKSFQLNHAYNNVGTSVVRVVVTDKDGGTNATTFNVSVLSDNVPPTVTGGQFNYTSGPRTVTVTFSEDVSKSLDKADLIVHNLNTNTDYVPSGVSWDASSFTATWTLGGLPDGNYHATLPAGSVTDASNNGLAQPFTTDFWFMNGDANRDKSVDFSDLVILAQSYNTTGKTFAQGDFTGDGAVDFNDLVVLAQRYNTALAAPPAGAAPAAASATVPTGVTSPMPSIAAVLASLQTPTAPKPTPKPAPAPTPVAKPTPAPKPAPKLAPKPAPKVTAAVKAPPVAVPPASVFGTQRITARKVSDVLA
jgi:hypothetical protein